MIFLMYATEVNDLLSARSQLNAVENSDVSAAYKDFVRVFSKMNAEVLLSKEEHSIDLIESRQSSYRPLYSMFTTKLDQLRKYLEEMQQRE